MLRYFSVPKAALRKMGIFFILTQYAGYLAFKIVSSPHVYWGCQRQRPTVPNPPRPHNTPPLTGSSYRQAVRAAVKDGRPQGQDWPCGGQAWLTTA